MTVMSKQLSAGVLLVLDELIYVVDSAMEVKLPQADPVMKVVLRDLRDDTVVEKNFSGDEELEDVSATQKSLEFLYREDNDYLFLDADTLDIVSVREDVVADRKRYLKESVSVVASVYNESVFSLELPQFMELMVSDTEESEQDMLVADTTKLAVLETGFKVKVPPFVEVGDVIKVDTKLDEFIQRV